MPQPFSQPAGEQLDQVQDYSSIYRDPNAPKPGDPEDLFKQLQTAQQAVQPTAEALSQAAKGGEVPQAPAPQGQTPSSGGGNAPQTPSTQVPGAQEAEILARLAPLGIKSVSEIRGKSDLELQKLSMDVVRHEQRQRDLSRYFARNADGSWDFTRGPDGRPTGLDAAGNVLPPGQPATPTAPTPPGQAPKAAKPAAKAVTPPKAKPAAKPAAKKPAARKPTTRTAARRATTRRRAPSRARVTAKPRSKPAPARRPAPLVRRGARRVAS